MGRKQSKKVKRVVITGGCGFIGLNLVETLKKNKQYKLRIIDNLSSGSFEDLKSIHPFKKVNPNKLNWKSRAEFVKGNICNLKLARKVTQGADVVIHLAAQTGVIPSLKNPKKDCELNVKGTLNYLTALQENGGEKFILASSSAPLGEQKPPIDEKKLPKPISPYGASKLAGEAYCHAFFGSYGLKTVILRFSNVYGEWSYGKGSVIAKFFKNVLKNKPLRIYGTGNQTRDFVYVKDLAQAIRKAISYKGGGEIFQIASGKETKINQLAQKIQKMVKKKTISIDYFPERKGEILRSYSKIQKARRKLSYQPKTTLETGLRKTWNWFLKH